MTLAWWCKVSTLQPHLMPYFRRAASTALLHYCNLYKANIMCIYIYIYIYVCICKWTLFVLSFKKETKLKKKKKKGCPQGEQYKIYTWIVKKKKITMHICMFIYMHRRMGTICFLSKSQNFLLCLWLKDGFYKKKKKKEHTATAGGVFCHEKYNIYMWMVKRKG